MKLAWSEKHLVEWTTFWRILLNIRMSRGIESLIKVSNKTASLEDRFRVHLDLALEGEKLTGPPFFLLLLLLPVVSPT